MYANTLLNIILTQTRRALWVSRPVARWLQQLLLIILRKTAPILWHAFMDLYHLPILGPAADGAPPLFLAVASDDGLQSAPHSVDMYSKWIAAKKPAALHAYQKGNHGFGMHKQNILLIHGSKGLGIGWFTWLRESQKFIVKSSWFAVLRNRHKELSSTSR